MLVETERPEHPEPIDELIDLIQELCGICLDHSKLYLIDSRIGSLVKRYGCDSFNDLAQLARKPAESSLRNEIIHAITTHETYFFRDQAPFDVLAQKILPDYVDQAERGQRPKELRVWSAAASTGQEAYSVAITLLEVIPHVETWDISILGTDVSEEALEKARTGVYSEFEAARGLDARLRSEYFVQVEAGWQVAPKLRDMVTFTERNLHEPFPRRFCFDIVLCRNVAIYFPKEQQDLLFKRIARKMQPEGHLILGAAESLADPAHRFTPQSHGNCTTYRLTKP